jgi:hypothetical protein
MVPSIFIHTKFSNDLVGRVLQRQNNVISADCKEDERLVFVMDDMMASSGSWVRSENIGALFCNGRHYKILFLLSLQYAMGIPPNLRNNVDYVFILRDNIVKNRRKLYDNWAGMFPSFDVFEEVMTQCTENFECIVIKNNSNSNKIEDCVFWYKASSHPNFTTCQQKYWDMDKQVTAKEKRSSVLTEEDKLPVLTSANELNIRCKRGGGVKVRKD